MEKISQMALTVFLMLPILNFGQAPALGSASGFTIFTAVGAFTNEGATMLTGDIGTNSGALTGFPPGIVNGEIHMPDAVTLQVASDVTIAYGELIGLACGTDIPSPLGNGQLLGPDIYCLNAATTLNGVLSLDGEGDPDAVFIFKIDGALTTNISSGIVLINAAAADNVYWQVNGEFVAGNASVFKGTLLVNGAINMLAGASLEGRALSIVGAVNTYAMSAVLPLPVVILPVELLYFNGTYGNPYNFLSWSTATEKDNEYFTLERTTDGYDFTEVARIEGMGSSSNTVDYTYSDNTFTRTINYYRLKQTDYSGNSQLFNVISIDNSQNSVQIVKMIDVLGREVSAEYEGLRFIYYENGTVVGRIGI